MNTVLFLLPFLLVGGWFALQRRRPRLLSGAERAALNRELEELPEVLAAVEEARQRWPEFLAAWRERRDEVLAFAVKGPVSDGECVETCWLRVTDVEDETVHGTINVQPCDLRGIGIGSQASFPVGALRDWMYVEQDETPSGCFTRQAIAQARADRERR